MKHIQTFNPARLTNAAHGQYITSAISILGAMVTENEKYKNDLKALEDASKKEDEVYMTSSKSAFTAVIQAADAQQDAGINGLNSLINAAQYDPAKREAGQKVADAVTPYRLDTKEQVAQEAYKVAQCAEALKAAEVSEAVTAIGATAFVEMMANGAKAVTDALRARNDERATATPAALANARLATDGALKEVLFTADAMLTLFGAESLPLLAEKVNELIAYTQQHMMTAPAAPADPNAGGQPSNPAPDPTPDAGGTGTGGVVTPVKPV